MPVVSLHCLPLSAGCVLLAEARSALEKLRAESALSRDSLGSLGDQAGGEVASLRSELEALRAQSQQDDAYKLQTMQYLRKYEGELQKKEKQLQKMEKQLQDMRAELQMGGSR